MDLNWAVDDLLGNSSIRVFGHRAPFPPSARLALLSSDHQGFPSPEGVHMQLASVSCQESCPAQANVAQGGARWLRGGLGTPPRLSPTVCWFGWGTRVFLDPGG